MDSGQISLGDLTNLLRGRSGPIRLIAVAGPRVNGVAPLWRAEIQLGPETRETFGLRWTYESCTFLSGALESEELHEFLTASELRRHSICGVDLEFELQPQCSFQRKPSLALHDSPAVPWPSTVYTAQLSQTPMQFQAPGGFLIGPGAPSFAAFGAAFNAFYYGDYTLSGTQPPLLGQVMVRDCDTRGRIRSVTIQAAQLVVDLDGDELHDSEVELMGTTDRAVCSANSSPVTVPLPNGLPADAWLWLRSSRDWFDYCPLTPRNTYSLLDIRDERFDEPAVSLAALISQGETLTTEFKSQLPSGSSADARRTALKDVIGFANGRGGSILYGVTDDGEVVGLQGEASSFVDSFSNVLRAFSSPMPVCHCAITVVDGKSVLVVEVEGNSGTIHALTVEREKPEFYVRRGATTFPARSEELQSILRTDQTRTTPNQIGGWLQ